MSKHPIPDWLRSQFSRIEDDVRKLGPCGVFTQMRTVTQTYFEQQVVNPQPPALGGEPIKRFTTDAYFNGGNTYVKEVEFANGHLVKYKHHADYVAALQAENRRLRQFETALSEWADKTEWLRKSVEPKELGMHLADVMKGRIDRLSTENVALRAAGEVCAGAIPRLDDARKERDQLKARCDELEGLLREIHNYAQSFEQIPASCFALIEAALSKPAGSDKV